VTKVWVAEDDPHFQGVKRLLPEVALPAQAYLPGSGSRPRLDGPDPWNWGIDLFNHGYYWEAHEVWEALWVAAGKSTPEGLAVRGLIQAAAACLKSQQGNRRGVNILSARAIATLKASGLEHFRGVSLSQVMAGLGELPRPFYLRPVRDPSG